MRAKELLSSFVNTLTEDQALRYLANTGRDMSEGHFRSEATKEGRAEIMRHLIGLVRTKIAASQSSTEYRHEQALRFARIITGRYGGFDESIRAPEVAAEVLSSVMAQKDGVLDTVAAK